jgi:hypothetical protein
MVNPLSHDCISKISRVAQFKAAAKFLNRITNGLV